MRIPLICLAAVLLTAPAQAGPHAQVTDPSGDANYAGVSGGTQFPSYDITSVRWWNDRAGQHVTLSLLAGSPAANAEYLVRAATPGCDSVVLSWVHGQKYAVLLGCKPRQRRELAVPTWSGGAVTFTIPTLPSWFAKGTRVSGLGADTKPIYDLEVAAVDPPADTASGKETYVLGS